VACSVFIGQLRYFYLAFLMCLKPEGYPNYDEGYCSPEKQYQHFNSAGSNLLEHNRLLNITLSTAEAKSYFSPWE
jgi:hypothetical protein